MSAAGWMPHEAAQAINDMLDNCAEIQPGQHVLILAAPDGLHGGRNLVDETAVAWVQMGVQLRGAHPTVMWADMPVRRQLIWPDIPTVDAAWRIPPIVERAMRGADVLISHVADLSSEEHLKEMPNLLKELKLPMVRNMAVTAPLLTSEWARTPHELIAEIRYRMAELVKPGASWALTHPNGTRLDGEVGEARRGAAEYAYWRRDGWYRPFPDGIYPAVNPVRTNGVLVFRNMMPVWARNIGVPVEFERPVTIEVVDNKMTKVDGGAEAEKIKGFLGALAEAVGDDAAFEIRGPHGGVHPNASVSVSECPDPDYREFIASFHPNSMHMHLGEGGKSRNFPFSLHTAAEVRGAKLVVGDRVLHGNGRLAVFDDPRVLEVAKRHPDRPGIGPLLRHDV